MAFILGTFGKTRSIVASVSGNNFIIPVLCVSVCKPER
ncbi:Uncharacterised protein [Streptococcus pneumoniae]|nr:Uncharacterised protein [Streptococcus pneumoniae]